MSRKDGSKKTTRTRSGMMVPSSNREGLPPETGTDPHRLARRYLQRVGHDHLGRLTLRHWRGQWWPYEDGRYLLLDEGTIRNDLTAIIKAIFDLEPVTDANDRVLRVGKSLVTNTLHALASMTEVPERLEQPVWLEDGEDRQFFAMSNGLIDQGELLAGEVHLREATPAWFSRVQFPYPFQPGADCPRWKVFLREVLEDDAERIALLQEWFGYCLVHDTRQHKFMLLEGEGANGKSVVLDVLTALVGPENVSNVPLEAFNMRFQLASTIGKLVNIASEVGDTDRPSEAVLKQFVAGERLHCDRKFLPPVEAKATARLVLAANNRPRFSDGSGGLWRRMLIVPFRVVIPEERQDKQLAAKLLAELPGIFNWSIVGLRRLYANGGFTVPAICREALDEYRMESNPARTFLTEGCQPQPGALTPAQYVYGSYVTWCDDHGYKPLNASGFGKEVKRAFAAVKRVRVAVHGGARVWHYDGLSHGPTSPITSLSSRSSEEREK